MALATNEKKYVKFNTNCSPYLAGEVGLFPIVASLKLVGGARPIGYYVKRNDKNEWVPDQGEENDNAEQTNQNGSAKQVGPEGGEGDGGEASPKPVQAAAAKTTGQGRRQRAKL